MYAKLSNSITKLVKFQDPHHSQLLVPLRFGVLKYCALESLEIFCVWWLGAAFDTAGVYNNQQHVQISEKDWEFIMCIVLKFL